MGALVSLVAVGVLALVGYLGGVVGGLGWLLAVIVPWVAFVVFVGGIIWRVVDWARSPVPFRIPTTSGQQRALPWIKPQSLENPHTTLGVLGRMALEVLFFRSLFRNTKTEVMPDREKVVHSGTKYLWAAGMAFHWAMLVIVIRHGRFFAEPIPWFVDLLQSLDGFLQVGVPTFYVTSFLFLAGLAYLLGRRLLEPYVRHISLPADYFALYLLLGVGLSGVAMRHLYKVDLAQVKAMVGGWFAFEAVVPAGVGGVFFMHLLLVCALLVYIPFSKLLHMPGVFLSPTRNLANTNREKHHTNPWNPEVEVHTYEEWEEEFRDKLEASGYVLEGK
jgi:nitrate reductase gamma subunit